MDVSDARPASCVWTRPFNSLDVPAIVQMVGEAFTERYPESLWADVARYWPDGFIVALRDGEVIGAAVGVRDAEASARILILVVKPDHRGRGLGRMLLERFLGSCRALGVRAINLEVRKTNEAARRFYERNGFAVRMELPCFYTDGTDAWQMAIDLSL